MALHRRRYHHSSDFFHRLLRLPRCALAEEASFSDRVRPPFRTEANCWKNRTAATQAIAIYLPARFRALALVSVRRPMVNHGPEFPPEWYSLLAVPQSQQSYLFRCAHQYATNHCHSGECCCCTHMRHHRGQNGKVLGTRVRSNSPSDCRLCIVGCMECWRVRTPRGFHPDRFRRR